MPFSAALISAYIYRSAYKRIYIYLFIITLTNINTLIYVIIKFDNYFLCFVANYIALKQVLSLWHLSEDKQGMRLMYKSIYIGDGGAHRKGLVKNLFSFFFFVVVCMCLGASLTSQRVPYIKRKI